MVGLKEHEYPEVVLVYELMPVPLDAAHGKGTAGDLADHIFGMR